LLIADDTKRRDTILNSNGAGDTGALGPSVLQSAECQRLTWIWIWKVIGKLPEGISRRWKTCAASG